jgi:hypothetical protein
MVAVVEAGNGVELLLTEEDLRWLHNKAWMSVDDGVLIARANRIKEAF